MKRIYNYSLGIIKALFLAGSLALPANVWAQLTGIEVEIYQIHDGVTTAPVPAGYVTYRVYITTEDPEDFVSGIYAFGGDDIEINTTTQFFQTPLGGAFPETIICALVPGFPELEFDSFLTIGKTCNTDPGDAVQAVATLPSGDPWTPWNTSGGNLSVQDGIWFVPLLPSAVNAVAGPDLKVLVAQLTTDGCIDGFFNVLMIDDSVAGQSIEYFGQSFQACNPCPEGGLVVESTVLNDILCFGESNGSIQAEPVGGADGNGGLSYELYNSGDLSTPLETGDPDGLFDGLGVGDYTVIAVDMMGCRDTTLSVTITEPTELTLSASLDQGITCAGDETGEISIVYAGGTAPLTVELNGVPQADGVTSFTNLACGTYVITVTDANDCLAEETIEIDCPSEVTVDVVAANISCFGACDGTLDGTISGGSGDITVTISGPDGFEQILTGSPVNMNLADLCPGDYTVAAEDANGCTDEASFTLTEPEELLVNAQTTDVSCFGLCDGAVALTISGGTGPYEQDFGGEDPDALCAGTYTFNVTDANDCSFEVTVTIEQPAEIVFTYEVVDVTCPNDNDGSVTVDAVGGVPPLSYTLTGAGVIGPQPENVFNGLGGGNYTLTIEDATGCSVSDQFSIFAPAELTLEVTAVDVTCNGFNDGSIVADADGGTGTLEITLNGGAGGPVFEDLAPDVYLIEVTDENGCTISANETISEPDALELSLISVTEIGCGGECTGTAEVEITGGTPNYELVWNDNPFIGNDELCAGINTLEVTDANGCVETLEVEVEEPEPIQILINSEDVTCTGMSDGSAAVVAIGGTGELTLDLGDLTPEDLNSLPEGVYPISASDETGCFANDTIFIGAEIITDLAIEIFTSPVSCWNEGDGTATAAITGGNEPIEVIWNDPLQQTTPIAIGLAEGLYTVTIVDAIGCTVDTVALVEPTVGCFFIATALTPNGDGANDEWLIGGLEYFPDATVQVYNRWGQILFESRGYNSPWNGTYNGQLLPIADYYYVISFDPDKDPLTGTVTIKY